MEFRDNALINFFSKNLWLTFFLNIKSVIQIIIEIFNNLLDMNLLLGFNLPPLGYADIVIFIASLMMFFMFRYLIHVLRYVSEVTTTNLNDSHRELDTKIRYLNFYIDNKNLDDENYIKKLHDAGFSKDDLEEIGISDDFIRKNKEKLLPRNVINKYNDFKNELNQHHKNKK